MSKLAAINHEAFARRFNTACEGNPNVPEPYRGRLNWFVTQFDEKFGIVVTDETIRKWLAGLSRPHHSKMVALAEILRVDVAWLATGESNGVTKKQAMIRNQLASGSVNLVAGLIQMGGGHPAFPAEGDQGAEDNHVDLYAIIRGVSKTYHIAAGEIAANGEIEFAIPIQTGNATIIGVVPMGGLKYNIVEIDKASVEQQGTRSGDLLRFSLNEVDHKEIEAF